MIEAELHAYRLGLSVARDIMITSTVVADDLLRSLGGNDWATAADAVRRFYGPTALGAHRLLLAVLDALQGLPATLPSLDESSPSWWAAAAIRGDDGLAVYLSDARWAHSALLGLAVGEGAESPPWMLDAVAIFGELRRGDRSVPWPPSEAEMASAMDRIATRRARRVAPR